MIRLIAFAAFALALATSAHAMSPPPLHQSDGISAEARYRGVARGYGGYRRYGYGGIGATATADIAATAGIGTTAAGIGLVMESPAAKSAGARCGVQATFAVDGYIETPNALSGEGL
jgi:hypothetical protein